MKHLDGKFISLLIVFTFLAGLSGVSFYYAVVNLIQILGG